VISFFYWSIKLLFHPEEKLAAMLIIPSSWGFPTGPVIHQGGLASGSCGIRGFGKFLIREYAQAMPRVPSINLKEVIVTTCATYGG
jgi:hypothetical protein